MSYFSSLYLPGALALWCALFFALAALWGWVQTLARGDDESRLFARRAYNAYALSITLAAAVLMVLLLRRDFRIEYVHQYSGLDLPWFFQFAAFWAGQKGSFLVWLLWGTLLGLPLYRAAGKDEAPVMTVYVTLGLLGLVFILTRWNPFTMLAETPLDGEGLNPLLQDNWMVIHPPIMFIGFALSAVPFAFAIASLWRRQHDRWAAQAFPWALAGFLVLGTAILMGGYWAYKTLGWGGYWGWDPVENASLVPWLFSTVLIHGLHMERAKGRYRRANYVFAALVFASVLYGTFLTRSGVLADFSVHSFVDLGISGWLIGWMAAAFGVSGWLFATELRRVPTARTEDPLLARGTFLVLSTITVAVLGVVVLIGTSAPLITRFLPNPGQVGPEFYNRVNLPLALLVAFLLAVVPYLTWRGAPPRELLRRLAVPAAISALVTGAAAVAAVRDPFHLGFLFLALLALLTNLWKTVGLARSGGLRVAGGYLAHAGVGVILIGILASSAYDHGAKVTLEQGRPVELEDKTLTFTRMLGREGRLKERMEIQVTRADGDSYFAYPQLFVNDRTRQLMVHPHLRKFLLRDLYISPIEFDPGEPPGADQQVELARGETSKNGELEIRFLGFDLEAEGNAMAQMANDEPVTVGAMLEIVRAAGAPQRVEPLYRFRSDGRVETPPAALPGGGSVYLTGINASQGAIQLALVGVSGPANAGRPPQLSVDVTTKPLINMVWYGLYVVLAGGILAAAHRLRQLRRLEHPAPSPPG
jgi:cytochrome c-type biogenesis protein CcmF